MSLGDSIRAAREAAHISIEDLSAITSIRPGLLYEIENNDFTHCGGETYARGHIRTLATKLGIDPQIWIDLYLEEHSTERRNIHEMLVESSVTKVPMEAKRMSWKVPASISLLVIVVIGIVQIIITNTNQPTVNSTPTVVASSEPTAQVAETATPSAVASPVVTGKVSIQVTATRGNSQVDFVVDGQHLYKGPMLQGDTKSFEGATSISVYFSNPAGLDVTVNGQLLAPLGGENQEVRRTFRSQ